MAALKAEVGGVQQDLGTIGERELAVAQIFTFLLVFLNACIIIIIGGRLDNPLAGNGKTLGGGNDEVEVSGESIPLRDVKVLGIDQVGSKTRSVGDRNIGNCRNGVGALFLVHRDQAVGKGSGFDGLDRRQVRAVRICGDFTDLTEGGNGSTNNATGFRVTDRSLDLDQTREELGDERMDGDDDGDTALSSSELLVETAREGGYSLQVSMSVVMNGKLLHTRLTLGTVRTLSRKSTDSVNSDPHRLVKSSLPCQVKR